MGSCASSKKEKRDNNKKLNTKSKSTDQIKPVSKTVDDSSKNDSDTSPVVLEKDLIDQIKRNEVQVVEYIVKIVHKDLNTELVKHATPRTVSSQSADLASTALAATTQQENDDLISDVASKAINTIVNTPLPNTTLTYKSLNLQLRSWPFSCKNQTNNMRICDLTTETIRNCLKAINEELHTNSKFDLISFLHQDSSLTPPATPDKKDQSEEEIWNQNAILLNRTKANQLARLLFLSNKARPVIHSSNRIKDAYFVNRELPDKTQVSITQQEIDTILNNSTYKNNPVYTPISPRKIDFSELELKSNNTTTSAKDTVVQNEESTIVIEERKIENNTVNGESDLDKTCVTADDLTWSHFEASDFEKVDVQLTTDTEQPTSTETPGDESTDTNVADKSETEVPSKTTDEDFLENVVNEINNSLQASNSESKSDDTEKIVSAVSEATTVTPPTTPNNETSEALLEIVKEINQPEKTIESEVTQAEEATPEKVEAKNETEKVADEDKLDPALKQALLDDRFYNNNSFKEGNPVNGNEAGDEAAAKIQAGFKGNAVRQGQNEELNNGAN